MPTQAALRPLEEIYLPKIVAADLTMNLGRLIGLRGWWSAVPFVAVVAAAVATIVVCTRPRSESASGLA